MTANASYAERFIGETDEMMAAREHAIELGATPIGPGEGAALRFLAAAIGAGSVVEIGTGAGVSGLHLFAGMRPDGILTSIDVEAEHQRAARAAFTASGIGSSRARLINGRAIEVLPRLTDSGYDLVLIDGSPEEYPQYVAEAIRLLRPHGTLVVAHALAGDRVADPTNRDRATVAVRDAIRSVRDSDDLTAVLLPMGDGLLAAARR